MSKYEPKNREEAFAYQIEDDIKLLHSLSMLNDTASYEKQLQTIEQRIASYRQLRDQEILEKKELSKERWQVVAEHNGKAYFTGSYLQCMRWREESKIANYELIMKPFLKERIISDISELMRS